MRTRPHDWYDEKQDRPMYGVQVRKDGRWMHVLDNSGPCIYPTESERDAKRAELRRKSA